MAEITETKRYRTSSEESKKFEKERDTKIREAIKSKLKTYDKKIKSGGESFKSATKMYRAKPKLSQTLLSYGAGFSQVGATQRVQAGPGRPAGVLKHRSPFTGKPIPAPQFYKEMRAFKRVQAQQADIVQQQQQQRFAKQGVPPQQIQNVVEQRMRQQFVQQQMQQRPTQPVQMPQQFQRPQGIPSQAVRPIWRRYNVIREERDLFGNVKQINSGNDPRNFWN